jgi:hypothetical protein
MDSSEQSERVRKMALHLAAAFSFRVGASSTLKSTGGVLLPPIGHYYSLFHISMVLCWLNPLIDRKKLERIRHSTLKGLIETYYCSKGIIDQSFLDLMNELQEEREWLNYRFGEFSYDFKNKVLGNEQKINREFKVAIDILKEVDIATAKDVNLLSYIQGSIGDSFGDDVLDTYLSVAERRKVMDAFLHHQLTT